MCDKSVEILRGRDHMRLYTSVGILFAVLFFCGCSESEVPSSPGGANKEENNGNGLPAKQPQSLVFRAKVAEKAVEALPGLYASYSVSTVYVIECGDRYVMVDTGLLRDVESHLTNFEKAGIDLERIDAIFTSHFHYDHVAGIARAKELLGCKVVAHRENVHAIETGDTLVTAREMPYIPGYTFPFPPCKVDIYLF